MSASSKKKLRREQEAGTLTERQKAELAEAKKLRTMTVVFVTVIALVLVATIGILAGRAVTKSGIREKSTIALTVDGEKLNSVEFSYYYIDAINSFYSNMYNYYGDNTATYINLLYGLDVTKSLDEQVYSEETGETWADYFIGQAVVNAQSTYALYNEAMANGFTLTEDQEADVKAGLTSAAYYALMYGYSDVDSYLSAMYGNGSDEESYTEYYTMSSTAYYYQTDYYNGLTYDSAAISEYVGDRYDEYSSYSYNLYTVYASSYLEGGTEDEDGNMTYTDEETAASVEKAEAAANGLIEGITTIEELDANIAALPENAEKESAASTAYTDRLYTNITADVAEWLADGSRVAGDMTVIPYVTTTTEEHEHTEEEHEHVEVETVNGYYVVVFNGVNENLVTLPSVRHLLVAFEGGTTDETTGVTTYSDDEKAAAKAEAEELLAQWQAGDATEDSFAALANENSDDGDGTTGGLYENIYPGQMVEAFEDWSFADHAYGDVEIIESSYGYHIMYYVSAGDQTYRDYMITAEMKDADLEEWYNALVEAVTVEDGDTSRINREVVISG